MALTLSISGHLLFWFASGDGALVVQSKYVANQKGYGGVVSVGINNAAVSSPKLSQANLKANERKQDSETEALGEQAKEQLQVAKKNSDTRAIIPVEALPEHYYFSVQELTEKPKIVQDVISELPLVTTPLHPTIIRLFISDYGDVDQVMFEDPNFPVNTANLIKKALIRMKFQPGLLEDIPVRSQIKIEVTLQSTIQLPE